jgi:serine/threonine protein kinase
MAATARRTDGYHLFTLLHPERYEDIETYQSAKAGFRKLCKRLLPVDFLVEERPGMWCNVRAPRQRIPSAGFKIHLSIIADEAYALLRAVIPILAAERACFRVLVDEVMLYCRNSCFWDPAGAGKFITIYPANLAHFKRLIERLYTATRRFKGPYVLSDRRYKDSKVVFYGYGGFLLRQHLTIYGEQIALTTTPDGREISDEPLPDFILPDGITDPFPKEQLEGETILNDRYKPLSLLGLSNKGGIYKCIDLETNKEVVVKEGRPFVSRGGPSSLDAVDCLRNEYHILKLLAGTGVTPSPIDFFQDGEHSFLAMELVPGEAFCLCATAADGPNVLEKNPDAAEVRRYVRRFIALAKKLICALRTIHARGVVIQDISPSNILYDAKLDRLSFVDFEAAYCKVEKLRAPLILLFTRGFGTARAPWRAPTVAGDYLALSGVLGTFLCLSSPFFALAPHQQRPMLEHIAKEKGIPTPILNLILAVAKHPDQLEPLLTLAERSIDSITEVSPLPPLRSDDALQKIIEQIGNYIRAQIHEREDPLDLPTDYRRFLTNPLSVAYGASGIAVFLRRCRQNLPSGFQNALRKEAKKVKNGRYPPGLYIGSSGIAWTLLELGFTEEAVAVMQTAAQSPLLYESADLFYGAAGFGLTNLFFFHKLGEKKYLTIASQVFGQLKSKCKHYFSGSAYTGPDAYFGLGHGAAGISYFLLRLYEKTGQKEHLNYARGLLAYDLERSRAAAASPRLGDSRDAPDHYPYWQAGDAGLGSVLLRFHRVLKEERYLEAAKHYAQKLAGRYTPFPSHFCGMAGLGSFFIDLFQHTGEKEYLDEARRFIDRIMLLAVDKADGLVFPGEGLLRLSTDYGTGSAGIGILIERVLSHTGTPYLDF